MTSAIDWSLPPHKVMAYLLSKEIELSDDYRKYSPQIHQRIFTISGITKLELVQDIRDSLVEAQRSGVAYREWEKNLIPTLQDKGWAGQKDNTPNRLYKIFHQNLRSSNRAVDYMEQMESTKEYLVYFAVLDSKTRPSHRRLHKIILPKDHPMWSKIYPPNGFLCRCFVIAMSKEQLERRGWKVTTEEELKKDNPLEWVDKGWDFAPSVEGKELKKVWLDKIKKLEDVELKRVANKAYKSFLEYVPIVSSEIVKSKEFKEFWENPKGSITIATIPMYYKNLLGAKVDEILLSEVTLIKNKKHHPEITLTEYGYITELLEYAELIVKDSDTTFVAIRMFDKLYYVAIKTTKTGKAIFLTSFRRMSEKLIHQTLKKGEIIKNELKPSTH